MAAESSEPIDAIHGNILANMADGVITLDLRGAITTFNPAAERLLGIKSAGALGRRFAEVFFDSDRFDSFNDLLIRAIVDSETTHSAAIGLQFPEGTRTLLVSTTFLRETDPDSQDDSGRKLGIIVVFSDISERTRRQKVERLFGQYVDPRIVGRMIAAGDADAIASERREMTIAFSDLEGFTGITEALDATDLVTFLNGCLGALTEPIARQDGVTDKYIGDAVMAYWGPPFVASGEPATHACLAAIEQRRRLPDLRRLAESIPHFPVPLDRIEIRCGIATGEVVTGNIGPEQSRNYTVVGDAVNVAARLEQANKTFGTRILASEATRNAAGDDIEFRELDFMPLRGRARPVRIYEVLSEAKEQGDQQARLRDAYADALTRYRARDFGAAIAAFSDCLEIAPQDGASKRMAERARYLKDHPPDASWDGTWTERRAL